MKHNFKLKLNQYTQKRTDFLDDNSPEPYALILKKNKDIISKSFHLRDLSGKFIIKNNLKDFFKLYDIAFTKGMSTDWQHKHRITFAENIFREYVSSKIDEIIRISITESFQNNESDRYIEGRWSIMHVEEFLKRKNLLSFQKLSKYPFIFGFTFSDNPREMINFITSTFDSNDYTFDFFPGNLVMVACYNEDFYNFLMLSSPIKIYMRGKIDFLPFLKDISGLDKIIETNFLRS